MSTPIRTLLFSTLFPSAVRPNHGIFVETRLRELLRTGKVVSQVVAPVPWFPFSGARFGEYGKWAATPLKEQREGVRVIHPRYWVIPRFGMNLAPYTLARAALPAIRRIIADGFDFDLIDAHYYYPDGVAASIVARALGKPFVVTARGTDVNVIPNYDYPRKLIVQTAHQAAASIGVSGALVERLRALGAPPETLRMFRNGVDLSQFTPVDRAATRRKLGWPEQPTLISVGNLVENKGHHIAIDALAQLPDFRLVIVGAGPEENALRQQATQHNLCDRVIMTGRIPQCELKDYYGSADILLLASSREGWPNVLLESMACGTPVIATRTGGVPEIIGNDTVGTCVDARSANAFAAAIRHRWANAPDREAVREYATAFGWETTTEAQIELFSAVIRNAANPGHGS